MAFDFPSAPAVGDKYENLGVTYTWNGTAWDLGTAEGADDKVSKAGDTMSGTLVFDARPSSEHAILIANDTGVDTVKLSGSSAAHSGLIEFFGNTGTRRAYLGYGDATTLNMAAENGAKWAIGGPGLTMQEGAGIHWGNTPAQTVSTNFSEGICLYGYGQTSQFGFTITSGTLNHVVQNIGNRHCFRVGPDDANNTRAIIDQNGIGPRNSYNVTFQNSFTGTMDFRVNPSMVTMRILNVKTVNAQVGTTQHVKICDYPAGVPAPWGNLYVHVEGCSDTAFTFLGRHAMVSAQTGGVFLSMYGGSTNEDFPANTYFSCTITWSR